MRILLDTHVLVWALREPDRLDANMISLPQDPDVTVAFSAASLWEIAIKAALRGGRFPMRPDVILGAALQTGFEEMPVSAEAAIRAGGLPLHHRDPFDRLLIAQAMQEPMRLYTADRVLGQYSELVTVIG